MGSPTSTNNSDSRSPPNKYSLPEMRSKRVSGEVREKEKELEREWSQVMEEDSLGHRDSCKAFKLKNHILKEPPSSANTYQVKK